MFLFLLAIFAGKKMKKQDIRGYEQEITHLKIKNSQLELEVANLNYVIQKARLDEDILRFAKDLSSSLRDAASLRDASS